MGMLLANSLMCAALLVSLQVVDGWQQWLWWQRAGHLAALCGGGALVYILALFMTGIRPRDFRPTV